MSRRNKTQENQVMTLDAFSNPMFRLGFGTQAPLEATEYPLTRLTDNYAKLNSMYRTGGILQSIVDLIPADMLREWFTLSDIDPDKQTEFDRVVLKTQIKDRIDEGLRWGRLYGGAVALILIKGQENNLDKPLDIKAIMPDSFAGLWILDRWSGVFPGAELVEDMMDPDFGLPKYYEIRTGENQKLIARVHHSRILRFTGRNLPYLEKIAEMYWGESEIEPVYEDIVLYDSIMANMGNLTFQANVETLAIKNLEQLFAVGSIEQQRRFWSMMQAQSVAKSNFGTRLIDQDTQLSMQQYSFAGFNYVVEAAQMNLSAKTHIPVTKLFGRSPAGMNATGDSDMQNYYDFIDGLRESRLRPILERLVPIICMSLWGKVSEEMDIVFPPLWTPTAMEVAQIAGAKSQAIIAAYQSGLLNQGPAMAELKKLSDETGMFDTIDDELIEKNKDTTFQDTQQMADPLAGLMGGAEGESDEEEPKEEKKKLTGDFDPDQPRDEDGKWTDGGGSGSKSKEDQIAELEKQLSEAKGLMAKVAIKRKINMLKEDFQGTEEEYKALQAKRREEEEREHEKLVAQRREEEAKKKAEQERVAAEKAKQLEHEMKTQPKNKVEQFKIIQEYNPMRDDIHVGIRKPSDIKTWAEVVNEDDGDSFVWGDFSKEDAKKALKSGKITIYSSYPIKQGIFVSTSKVQAEQYAGGPGNKVYTKTIPLENVAWINGDEGQYAQIPTNDEGPESGNFNHAKQSSCV